MVFLSNCRKDLALSALMQQESQHCNVVLSHSLIGKTLVWNRVFQVRALVWCKKRKRSLNNWTAISTNTQKRTICVASRLNPNAACWEGSQSLSIGGLYNALDDTETSLNAGLLNTILVTVQRSYTAACQPKDMWTMDNMCWIGASMMVRIHRRHKLE